MIRLSGYIDLSLEQSLEWLAIYSSQIGIYRVNNTILLDNEGFIIGFKDNGVRSSISDGEGSTGRLIPCKTTQSNFTGKIFIIDINKKMYNIDLKVKYNDDLKMKFYSTFLEFLETKDYDRLKDNLNKLNSYNNLSL